MERIKQAIDKAKKLQTAEAPSSPPASNAPYERPQPSAIENLSYSRTRIVSLDPVHLERHRIVAYNKNDPMSVSFDLLRTQVLSRMEENGWRTLAITSPTPASGKSVVAINLAISIAQHTAKTAMLVDFDLRRPSIAKYLGLSADVSLNEVLAGEADVADALVNPSIHRFVVLPTRRPERRPAEVLTSRAAESLITNLRNRYADRIVLFDLPPLLTADDALAVLPRIDCVLLVVGDGMTTKSDIQESLRHLPKANVVGTVLNKAQVQPRAYYYY